MNDEHDFNKVVSSFLDKKAPNLTFIKSSDKYTIGIPDFIVWADGTSYVFESKFIQKMPMREKSKILAHKFKGPQYTFLQRIKRAGCLAIGLIAVKEEERIYVINNVPKSGNFTLEEFRHQNFKGFYFEEINELFHYIHLLAGVKNV